MGSGSVHEGELIGGEQRMRRLLPSRSLGLCVASRHKAQQAIQLCGPGFAGQHPTVQFPNSQRIIASRGLAGERSQRFGPVLDELRVQSE